MKTMRLLRMMALAAVMMWACQSGAANSGFTLVREESGIRIFTRWIPVTSGRSARQIKAEIILDATLEDAVKVLRNDRSFTGWMNATIDYHRVKTVDSLQWYSYIRFSVPWPLNDQDCIIKYMLERPSEGTVRIVLRGEPSFMRTVDGVKRISHLEGCWMITSLDNNKVKVEYTMFSSQKSSSPRWITDPIIQNNLIKTMNGFHDEVKKSAQ